jgi:predicted ribosomally synthesized peptide with SipW-like signal peptide
MFNILRSLFVIAAAVAVVGGTYAYFSATETASGNTIATGSLSIDIFNQNTETALDFDIVGMMPGETALVNFDVKNTSTTDVQLRGAAFGAWATPNAILPTVADNTLVQVVKVERWDSSIPGWDVLVAADPITGYFYDSENGVDASHFTVPAGEKAQFQVTVKLDELTGDDYQNEVYDASIVVQARQFGAPNWPASLVTGF